MTLKFSVFGSIWFWLHPVIHFFLESSISLLVKCSFIVSSWPILLVLFTLVSVFSESIFLRQYIFVYYFSLLLSPLLLLFFICCFIPFWTAFFLFIVFFATPCRNLFDSLVSCLIQLLFLKVFCVLYQDAIFLWRLFSLTYITWNK